MFSRILASILAAVLLHGAMAGVLIAFSGSAPPTRERVYRVALVEVAGPAANKAPDSSESAENVSTPPSRQELVAESEQARPKAEEERPKTASKKKTKKQPEHAVAPRAVEVPAPSTKTVVQADATAAAPSGGGPSKTAETSVVDGISTYSEDVVDERPVIVRQILPNYPLRAKRLNIQGKVEIRLIVDTVGRPQKCVVHSASPTGFFEETALAATKRMRFAPGKIKGRPVNTTVLIPFVFSLR